MNYKRILFFLGIYSLFVSFFAFLNILYCLYFSFILDLNSYLVCFFISAIIGIIFYILGRKDEKNIFIEEQIIIIAVGCIYLPFLISLPYYFSSYNMSLLNSFFESASGITSTGFSIIENVQDINEPLLLWRSTSQWIGGMFFLIAIVGTFGSKRIKLKPTNLVSNTSFTGNYYNEFIFNSLKIFLIYLITTIIIIFAYNVVNIRFFDSVNLALTTISAGGFISKDDLSSIITNDWQIVTLSATFLFPIFNFYFFYKIISKQFKIREHHEDFHLATIIILTILIFYFFILPDVNISSFFLAITSSLSTSGIGLHFSNFNISIFLILLTIIGGSLISTSSGIKYIRIYILLKVSYQEIYKLVKPINIFNRNLFHSESKINDEDVKISFLVFISFIIAIFVLSGILTLDNLTFESSFKLSILTLTNTTTSILYGLDKLTFFDLSAITKLALIFFMIFAKIEIIAFLYFIKRFIFKE